MTSQGKVAVTDIANGTDGELITWNASGAPATVAVGTSTHVLTSNGTGVAPTFQAAYQPGGTDVAVADGGTNLSVYAVGDVVYASGTTVLAKLAKPGTPAGEVLTFAACATAPSWVAASGGVVSGGTNNAVLRADGTGGSTSQGSGVLITDANAVLIGCGSVSLPALAFKCDTDTGFFRDANLIKLAVGGALNTTFTGGVVLIGDTGSCVSQGLVVNQAANDDSIFALKSDDVAHGATTTAEADTYFFIKKANAGGGAANLYGFGDANSVQAVGIILTPVAGIAAQATKTTGGIGLLSVNAGINTSGTAVADAAANGNLFAIRGAASGNAKFIVDQDGDIFYDGSAAAYDSYCDAELTRTLAHTMQAASCEPSNIIRNKWDDFTAYNEQSLIDAGILGGPVIGVDPHNRGLVSLTQLQRLHNGAIWQLHSKLNDQAEELTALKGQLNALTEGK
jgi:hypothetical protein